MPHSSSRRRSVTKKPMRSRVSAVKILSGSSGHRSSAAAFMAGATTSRVVFINNSASHSKTFWICWGLGFCRSWMVKGMPMSLIHPAISRSGFTHMTVSTIRRLLGGPSRTHQRHKRVLIVFFACSRLTRGLLGASRRHAHAPAVCHIDRLVLFVVPCRKSGLARKSSALCVCGVVNKPVAQANSDHVSGLLQN